VARAKRTERAESRRRYRAAAIGALPEAEIADDAPAVAAAALPRSARERRPSSPEPEAPPPARSGFLGSLRAAAGPVDIMADLRALPGIMRGSKAFWLPTLIVVAMTVVMLTPGLATNQFVVLAGNVILQPPPMIMAFFAGMLAPRGAWMMGGLVGLVSGAAYVIVVALSADTTMTPLGFTYVVSADQKLSYAWNVLTTAPVFGIAVGAFSGFYRRFLNMSAAQRQAARGQGAQSQATRRR
jgi:hypothetical protein